MERERDREKVLKNVQKTDMISTYRHSDLGSLTLLFYQPIGGLQVLAKDGSWKDVRMVPGTLTVNLADALHFLTSKCCP